MIASQLIGGGPGPDYQMKKSKLEPGIRELTAVILIPTFLPAMRMNVTSNWFKLNDPEHLVFHTRRMMEQGRRVQEVQRTVLDACSASQYRDADHRVLRSKLAMLEAMLPSQSLVVQLPFDNLASGFDLFSDGATALVPELTGFSGVDVIPAPTAGAAAAPTAGTPGLQVSSTVTTAATTTTTSIAGGVGEHRRHLRLRQIHQPARHPGDRRRPLGSVRDPQPRGHPRPDPCQRHPDDHP